MALTDLHPFLHYVDLAAAAVFATTGALVAARQRLDIVGFVWLGVITGVGGGTLRDVVLGVPVFWVVNAKPVLVCAFSAVIVYFIMRWVERWVHLIDWLDAAGMALVTVAGTSKAIDHGTGEIVALAMGVTTAAMGGVIRDVIGQVPSVIMRREIYVTAALAGSLAYLMGLRLGASTEGAAALGFFVAFGVRGLAIQRGWALPGYRQER